MDEGMPWRIIMVFFFLGALLGIRAEINKQKKESENDSVSESEE